MPRSCLAGLVGLAGLVAIVSLAGSLEAQQESSLLRLLEAEIHVRITERARANGGFSLGAGEFDLRLAMKGEPEEVIGPTVFASDALAVGSARLEPLDTIPSRDSPSRRALYTLRLEDRAGNCLIVHQNLSFDSTVIRGRRATERCQPLYMAKVVRRARRIVRLPLTAGRLDDRWSAALAATGTADVYMDSVVITTSSVAIRASYPDPVTAAVVIDSVSAGLASGESSWSIVRRSPAVAVDTTLRRGGEWRRRIRRFVIPLDPDFDLSRSWPVFEIYLNVSPTADNPGGLAWTYAHEKKTFFMHPALSRQR
jgi:hypothetical protein